MKGHPFAQARFNQAKEHMTRLIPVLKEGNLNAFIEIVEREALSLHAMMMSSDPYFMLMKPNTLEIIERIWDFRNKTKTQLCFTLDAGANVHVLYPEKDKVIVNSFIADKLIAFCEKEQYIYDKAGDGALLL
jgi:diphosphomevalonate decarboxylase